MTQPNAAGVPIPADEEERLAEVLRHASLDELRQRFDGICRVVRRQFRTPTAVITLVGRHSQSFVGASGDLPSGSARSDAFCAWTVAGDGVFIVPDTRRDPRFCNTRQRLAGETVRFYAGAPIETAPGRAIGALCILDTEPRDFPAEDQEALQVFAALIVGELRRRRATLDLARRERLLAHTAEMTGIGSWEIDLSTGETFGSKETLSILELGADAVLAPKVLSQLIAGGNAIPSLDRLAGLLPAGRPLDHEVEIVTAAQNRRWVRCLAEPEFADGRAVRIAGTIQDVTARRSERAEMERLAYYDPLTGLANRALFQKEFARLIERARIEGTGLGLAVFDLDHFKDLNETLGHDVGDQVIDAVARRLESAVGALAGPRKGRSAAIRPAPLVARLGGDEFAIVLPDLGGRKALETRFGAVLEAFRQPFDDCGSEHAIAASAGAVAYPQDETDPGKLLQMADIALYQAKGAGRNRLVVFEAPMRAAVQARVELLREVTRAIPAGEFVLYYQPVVFAGETPAVESFEALLRWVHPTRGVLLPAAFQAALDDPEISLLLGECVIDLAIDHMRRWRHAGVEFGQIAINMSAPQFRVIGLAEHICRKLASAGLPPNCLAVEVTEHTYLGVGSELVRNTINALHRAGVMIALDDFGTGFASLATLQQLPIDRVKIDRCFVQDSGAGPILSAVTSLATGLGMSVVAEGVEQARQLEMVSSVGCDRVQGYYFQRPMPEAAVAEYLANFAEAIPSGTRHDARVLRAAIGSRPVLIESGSPTRGFSAARGGETGILAAGSG